ncbi:hypothetical protein BH23ACT10_BH23ACT10_21420 [soil metagenome]
MTPHRLDPVSLVFGVVFVFVGMAHLLGVNVLTGWATLLSAWPILLVAAGAAVIIGIVRSARNP